MYSQSLQSYPTLCDPMDCSPPGSSVHGILQARILEWVAMPFSRESSPLRDWTLSPALAGGLSTAWATRETLPATNSTKLFTDREMKSEWCTCALECYPALNQNGIMPVTTAWMDRVNTILRKADRERQISEGITDRHLLEINAKVGYSQT